VTFFFPLWSSTFFILLQIKRHVDSSFLGSSLSSHRQSYIGLVFSSHFIDLIINKNKRHHWCAPQSGHVSIHNKQVTRNVQNSALSSNLLWIDQTQSRSSPWQSTLLTVFMMILTVYFSPEESDQFRFLHATGLVALLVLFLVLFPPCSPQF
jgi:hypothetical protein